MKKSKSSKRKPKRLKMEKIISLPIIVLLSCLAPSLGAAIPQGGSGLASETLEQRTRNFTHETGPKDSRGLFSPRMDYEQWKPLGRGDPLQNDPTYDYVPPVLERVHYWVEPPARKQDGPPAHEGKKSEILVLGVSSKKSSTSTSTAENRRDPYKSFLKFIDGPKFLSHNHNSYVRPNQGQRPPHSPPHPFQSQPYKNRFDDIHFKTEEQRMPYTVLVPPPIPPPHMELPLFKSNPPPPPTLQPVTMRPVYQPAATTAVPRPTVLVQEANLIYHSSGDAEINQWQNGASQYGAGSQYVTWRTPTDNPSNLVNFQETETKGNPIVFTRNSSESNDFQFEHRPVQMSQSSENKRPYISPIVFPTETGRIVFEHHSSFNPSSVHSPMSQMPSRIVPTSNIMSGQPPLPSAPTAPPALHVLRVAGSQPAATQMAVGNQPMHKGQVSDDTIGNSYVNIGKPNAHIQEEISTNKPYIPNAFPQTTESSPNTYSPIVSFTKPNLQVPSLPANFPNNQINSVYTNGPVHKPVIISNGQPFSRRPGPITDDFTMQSMYTMQTMQPPPPLRYNTDKSKITRKPPGLLQTLLHKESSAESTNAPSSLSYTPATSTILTTIRTSTIPTPTTTAVASLTTDPLFKHYKQPVEPLRGPMYLIIQGHSKVKTYGPSNKEILREFSMPENNEIPQIDKYPVKHLHVHKENYVSDEKDEVPHSRSKNSRTLKDLISDGYGNFNFQEAEIGIKYEVSDGKTLTTSEKYHKGIVESEENEMAEMQKLKKKGNIRKKRQLEEFFPVVEDTVETYVYDYLKRQSEGSGVGAIVASAITDDSSEYDVNVLGDDDDDDDEDDDDDDDEEET